METPRRLFRNRPERDDLSDMFNVEVFARAARLLASFYLCHEGMTPDAVREKVKKLASYSLDTPWRGFLPVPFNEREQETVYAAMMAAMEETLEAGGSVPATGLSKKEAWALIHKSEMVATFLIDHHPDTAGPDDDDDLEGEDA